MTALSPCPRCDVERHALRSTRPTITIASVACLRLECHWTARQERASCGVRAGGGEVSLRLGGPISGGAPRAESSPYNVHGSYCSARRCPPTKEQIMVFSKSLEGAAGGWARRRAAYWAARGVGTRTASCPAPRLGPARPESDPGSGWRHHGSRAGRRSARPERGRAAGDRANSPVHDTRSPLACWSAWRTDARSPAHGSDSARADRGDRPGAAGLVDGTLLTTAGWRAWERDQLFRQRRSSAGASLKSLGDAVAIRNPVVEAFERADVERNVATGRRC